MLSRDSRAAPYKMDLHILRYELFKPTAPTLVMGVESVLYKSGSEGDLK